MPCHSQQHYPLHNVGSWYYSFAVSYRGQATGGAGYVAALSEERRAAKYSHLTPTYLFTPVTIESSQVPLNLIPGLFCRSWGGVCSWNRVTPTPPCTCSRGFRWLCSRGMRWLSWGALVPANSLFVCFQLLYHIIVHCIVYYLCIAL